MFTLKKTLFVAAAVIAAFSIPPTAVAVNAPVFNPTALTIDFGTRQVVLDEARLQGGWYNYADRQALTQGRNLFARAALMQENDTFEGTFPDIVQYLNKAAPQYEVAAYDGQINFQPHQTPRFTVTNQKPGRIIDRERLYRDILTALKGNRYPYITAYYQTVNPQDPAAILNAITKRSHFTTQCRANPDRETNIAIALAKFDGLRVNPGETVSFNQVVGRRNQESGYKQAKIIVNGEYVDGIGGGVCQVSTTIFNAVAQAGLHIIESHHHTLPSSYVALGCDAMVSSNADLRFVNNTGAPLYFETSLQNHVLSVTIYGRSKGAGIRYQLATEIVKEIAPPDKWDEDLDPTLIAAAAQHPEQYTRLLLSAGQPGHTVNTYLETYQGTRRLSRKLLRRSTYKATPNVYTLQLINDDVLPILPS